MGLVGQVVRSEWTKIRSVHSTVWTLGAALAVTVALGTLISVLAGRDYDSMSLRDKLTFDPTFISFSGTGLGQLAMIVFGVLVVSNEYSTGMIRTSLAAVPQRALFFSAKIAVATLLALLVSMATSFLSFFAGQAALGAHRAQFGDPGVARAVVGGGLYMTLIGVFSMGIAATLRSPMLSLGILMPFFFIVSNVLGNVPATKKVGNYLPDQAGKKIMQVVTLGTHTPYGPWGGLGIMALWVIAALVAGYVVLQRRDA